MLKKFLKRQSEKRKYIRHPAEIPIEYKISGQTLEKTDYTKNISFGGLCFQAQTYIEPGTVLIIKFPTISSKLEVVGKIVWCSQKKEYVDMGVEFQDKNEAYRAKIIEEICYLKNHQRKIFERDGVI